MSTSAKDINAKLGRRTFSQEDMSKMSSEMGVIARAVTKANETIVIPISNSNKLSYSITINIHYPKNGINEIAELGVYIGQGAVKKDTYIVTEMSIARKSTFRQTYKISSDENVFVFSDTDGVVIRLEGYTVGLY